MVLAHHEEILRDLERGRPQPIFDIDGRNGIMLWEMWIEGLYAAWALQPDTWTAVVASGDEEVVEAFACLALLAKIAADECALTSLEINAINDEAPSLIDGCVALLYAWRVR